MCQRIVVEQNIACLDSTSLFLLIVLLKTQLDASNAFLLANLTMAATSTQPTGPEPNPPLINRRRYLQAFQKITPDTGSTFYPCSEDDIKALTSGTFKGPHSSIFGGPLTKEKATTHLERFLLPGTKLSASETQALQNLRNMLTWENTAAWGPDIFVRTCYDWDKVFFNGRLKGHITIQWQTEENLRKESRSSNGWACRGQCRSNDVSWRWGHCQIELNADIFLLCPEESRSRIIKVGELPVSHFKLMWAIFLHELCHAYLGITTGHKGWRR